MLSTSPATALHHYQGLNFAASATAIEHLLAHTQLDVAPADPHARQPYYY